MNILSLPCSQFTREKMSLCLCWKGQREADNLYRISACFWIQRIWLEENPCQVCLLGLELEWQKDLVCFIVWILSQTGTIARRVIMKLTLFLKINHLLTISKGPLYLANSVISRDLEIFGSKSLLFFPPERTDYPTSHYFPVSTCW